MPSLWAARFVAGVEFFGGLLLILGLATRITGLILSVNMLVAYGTASRDALFSIHPVEAFVA